MRKLCWKLREMDWDYPALETLEGLRNLQVRIRPLKESAVRRTGRGVLVTAIVHGAAEEELLINLMEAYGMFGEHADSGDSSDGDSEGEVDANGG
jgi:hypothetical protein